MLRFDDLQLFVTTADLGNLSAAARRLDISPAVASAALKRLEQQLDVRLFSRSTRSLRLTPEGELFLGHARLQLRLLLGDRVAALFREPVDIALRYGAPEDSSLVALPVAAANRRVLCAAPQYLHKHGTPQTVDELSEHNCLL